MKNTLPFAFLIVGGLYFLNGIGQGVDQGVDQRVGETSLTQSKQELISEKPSSLLDAALNKIEVLPAKLETKTPEIKETLKAAYQLSVISPKIKKPKVRRPRFSGEELSFGKNDLKKIDLPFSFPFFDSQFETIYVSLNGSVFLKNPETNNISKVLPGHVIHAFQSELSYPSSAFGVRTAVELSNLVE